MKQLQFESKEIITLRKVIESDPCERGLVEFLRYISDETDVVTLDEVFDYDLLYELFDLRRSWYDWAREMGWVIEKWDPIDPTKIYRDHKKNLYRIEYDRTSENIIVFNITKNKFENVYCSEMEGMLSQTDSGYSHVSVYETIQALAEFMDTDFEETNLLFHDLILKKYQ